jgi:hypothetical protein
MKPERPTALLERIAGQLACFDNKVLPKPCYRRAPQERQLDYHDPVDRAQAAMWLTMWELSSWPK